MPRRCDWAAPSRPTAPATSRTSGCWAASTSSGRHTTNSAGDRHAAKSPAVHLAAHSSHRPRGARRSVQWRMVPGSGTHRSMVWLSRFRSSAAAERLGSRRTAHWRAAEFSAAQRRAARGATPGRAGPRSNPAQSRGALRRRSGHSLRGQPPRRQFQSNRSPRARSPAKCNAALSFSLRPVFSAPVMGAADSTCLGSIGPRALWPLARGRVRIRLALAEIRDRNSCKKACIYGVC